MSWIDDLAGYRSIESGAGVAATTRRIVRFVGATVTDDGTRTLVEIPQTPTQASGFSVLAKVDTGSGTAQSLTLGTNTLLGRQAGNVVAARAINAQLADVPPQTLKGNSTGATAAPSDLDVDAVARLAITRPQYAEINDWFIAGGTLSLAVGDSGLCLGGVGTPAFARPSNNQNLTGQSRTSLQTSGATNDLAALGWGNTLAQRQFNRAQVARLQCALYLGATDTGHDLAFGLWNGDGSTTLASVNDFLLFYRSGSTWNITSRTGGGAVATTAAGVLATANAAYNLCWINSPEGTWTAYINGASVIQVTAGLPNNNLNPVLYVRTTVNAMRQIHPMYMGITTRNLGSFYAQNPPAIIDVRSS